ncbi:MAG: DUF5615 family PIN-like protein [Bacteroidota bacterium]
MTLWIDAMLSPALAPWITEVFDGVEAFSLKWLGLHEMKDPPLFNEARKAGAVLLSKDVDHADEATRRGSPPVIWVRAGNTSTRAMKEILSAQLPAALDALRAGESVAELSGD